MLALENISKAFSGVPALHDVSFDLNPGEVHVLFGENGAGKSTLINIISGVHRPDGGRIEIKGSRLSELTAAAAREAGIATVFQEFRLVPSLSVTDNIFLGREMRKWGLLRRRQMRAGVVRIMRELDFDVDPDAVVETLPRAQRQMTEIAKALLGDANILILDEPTASLSDVEADNLLKTVAKLRARGVGIIYVSHRMPEIRRVADRITVLRSGRLVGTVSISDVSEALLVEMMTGRRIDALFPRIEHSPGQEAIAIQDLCTVNRKVEGATLSVRQGEIVGLAGLVGCGKSDIGQAIYGLLPVSSGEIRLKGEKLTPSGPRAMLSKGVCYFPSDRAVGGLALKLSLRENCSIAALDLPSIGGRGFIRRGAERRATRDAMSRLGVRPLDLEMPVAKLSGGNKQKVLLSRGLLRPTDVFIFDEPTVGIDVGAKVEVYNFIRDLVEGGAAVLLISSELPELLALANRIYVVHNGHTVSELGGDDRTETNVLKGFFGRAAPPPEEVANGH